MQIPKTKKIKIISVSVENDLLKQFNKWCKQNNVKRSKMVNLLIQQFLETIITKKD